MKVVVIFSYQKPVNCCYYIIPTRLFPELPYIKGIRDFCAGEMWCLILSTSLDNIINNGIYWLWGNRKLSDFQYFAKADPLFLQPVICRILFLQKKKKSEYCMFLRFIFNSSFILLQFKYKHLLYFNNKKKKQCSVNEIVYLSIQLSQLVS